MILLSPCHSEGPYPYLPKGFDRVLQVNGVYVGFFLRVSTTSTQRINEFAESMPLKRPQSHLPTGFGLFLQVYGVDEGFYPHLSRVYPKE